MKAWQDEWLLKEVLLEFFFKGLQQQTELNILLEIQMAYNSEQQGVE